MSIRAFYEGTNAMRYGVQGELDERDEAIVAARVAELDAVEGPRVGDFVIFADDKVARVAHIWRVDPVSVQTSAGGSFYLGDGHVSMSGSLFTGVPGDTLTRTDEVRNGSVWIFHHDWHTAQGGVSFEIPFRVYRSTASRPAC